MIQIKIFTGDTEDDINNWLKGNKDIEIINVNRIPMFDRYSYGEGLIDRQWVDTVITYNIHK